MQLKHNLDKHSVKVFESRPVRLRPFRNEGPFDFQAVMLCQTWHNVAFSSLCVVNML